MPERSRQQRARHRAISGAIQSLEPRRLLATFTVTNVLDSGAGSLRAAILSANAASGADVIQFNLSGTSRTIRPTSDLPAVVGQTAFDATTQPGYAGKPLVELDGTSAGVANGLRLLVANSSVRGLAINRFSRSGISIGDGVVGCTIRGCFIGTDISGFETRGNGWRGIEVLGDGNTIGGTAAGDRNVVGGNANDAGIYLDGNDNVLLGNYVGVSQSEFNFPLSNGIGITITGRNNTIGGTSAGAGNVIGTSEFADIQVYQADGARILGNTIGRSPSFTGPDTEYGIFAQGATNMTVGGDTAAARNVIANIEYDAVHVWLGSSNTIAGNFIGTDVTGTEDRTIKGNGIYLRDSSNNTVGGRTAGSGNRFLSAYEAQLAITGLSSNNQVLGNSFGIESKDQVQIGAGLGIEITGTGTGNQIGDPTNASRNLFRALDRGAIHVHDAHGGGTIINNDMGSSSLGLPASSIRGGVMLVNASGWSVTRNVIAYAYNDGISLESTSGPSNNNTFFANRVGVMALDDTPAMTIGDGIRVNLAAGGSGNVIGNATGGGNIFANSTSAGVRVQAGSGVVISGNSVYGNANGAIVLNAAASANGNQPAPVISAVGTAGGQTIVRGTLSAAPNATYSVEFFASPARSDGQRDARTLVGTRTVTTAGNGATAFEFTLPVALTIGEVVTATARAANGNTSVLSNARVIVSSAPPTLISGSFDFETGRRFQLSFSDDVSASLATNDLELRANGQTFKPTFVSATSTAAGTVATFMLSPGVVLPDGVYTATVPIGSVRSDFGTASNASQSFTFHVLAGDANRDRSVNFDDLLILAKNFGQTGRTFGQGNVDYSNDGSVNFDDLLVLAKRFNTTLPAAVVASPSPAAVDDDTPRRATADVLQA